MLVIIVNPLSGGATPAQAAARARLAAARLEAAGEPGDVFVSAHRGHARELSRAAVSRGARLVVAWGGDGTVNEVAASLVGSECALGIVPAGSGNGLARELQLPSQPEAALDAAIRGQQRRIDAGELGGRLFFSIAGIGFDAHVAAAFDRDAAGSRGFSTYARITARELWRYRSRRYQVDGAAAVAALLVTFANSAQFGNGARIAPSARIDDGLLDLVLFEERSRLRTLWGLPRLFTGGVERVAGVSIRQVQSVVVESDAPMAFHVDGEPVQGGTRLEARVHPGVLRVTVGAQMPYHGRHGG
jgi:YegS/Rv2252/BmrU family lipid kinase